MMMKFQTNSAAVQHLPTRPAGQAGRFGLLTLIASSAIAWICPTTAGMAAPPATESQPELTRGAVESIMRKVADWQLAHPSKRPMGDWVQGPFVHGLFALGSIPENQRYLDEVEQIGRRLDWKLVKTIHPANDHCSPQTWLDLYALKQDPAMLEPTRKALDKYMANSDSGDEDVHFVKKNFHKWSWCDALYMSPPTFVRLANLTGEKKYLDYSHKWWWIVSKVYYDDDEHLWFRDQKFMGGETRPKVYWARGNGWVLGGLVRVLQVLPKDDPMRPRYEQQFREMSGRLLELQQPDHLWPASLTQPEKVTGPESSGSGFFIYGLAWGINEGLIDRKHQSAVFNAWRALTTLVKEDGQLTRVQPVGEGPNSFNPDSTLPYGVGAFLLAGSEVWKLAK
jgi:rhamnogalacturonyl hydrolase YesR